MAVINAIVELAAWLAAARRTVSPSSTTTPHRRPPSKSSRRQDLFVDIVQRTDLAGRPRFVTAVRASGQESAEKVVANHEPGVRLRGRRPARPPVSPRRSAPLKGGRLVVLPTDTVYGIGADAFDSTAVAALLAAKGRGRDMPVPVLVGSWHTIDGLVYTVPAAARELIRAFWPGALSLVVRQAPSLQWDLGDANGTVMLRMPLHPVAIEVLREVGPMAVSSANISGRPAAVTAEDARDQLGDRRRRLPGRRPAVQQQAASTIVDLTGAQPRILRTGPVAAEAIAEVLGVDADNLTAAT